MLVYRLGDGICLYSELLVSVLRPHRRSVLIACRQMLGLFIEDAQALSREANLHRLWLPLDALTTGADAEFWRYLDHAIICLR